MKGDDKCYREALYWYEECIGVPIVEEYYYFIDDPKYNEAKKQFLKKEYRRAMNEYRYLAQEYDDGIYNVMGYTTVHPKK